MNQLLLPAPSRPTEINQELREVSVLSRLFMTLSDSRWLVVFITILCTLGGLLYALAATPLYEANLLVQVEDMSGASGTGSSSAPKNIQGDLSGAFDIRTATASEIEILRSRAVVRQAVENLKLYIDLEPHYFPVIGAAVARYNKKLSTPGIAGHGGYVWGREDAAVSRFDVPPEMEGRQFVLRVGDGNTYRLLDEEQGIDMQGRVGQVLAGPAGNGQIVLQVDRIAARPGAEFLLTRRNVMETVKRLQSGLRIAEYGKQSGIIGLLLDGPDPKRTAAILNDIGQEYFQQNIERKSEKAKKSLKWLDRRLPALKTELEDAETRYKEMRHRFGAVDIGEEGKVLLQQTTSLQMRLTELSQKKIELLTRFEPAHPYLQIIAGQERELNGRIAVLNNRIKQLPGIEQEMLRLSRDVKVNTELYTSLLGTAQQLRLVASSEVGNARILDPAVVPSKPVKPHRVLVVALSALAGLVLGVLAAVVRKMLVGKVGDPVELEMALGLPVSAAIPYSENQERLYRLALRGGGKPAVLPHDAPDGAIEGLRSLRAALQFTMNDAVNNIVMITGPTQGVGKSFVSANLSSVLASIGKRVLLIDADLRAGDLHRYFNADHNRGMSDALGEPAADRARLDQLIQHDVARNLDFLAAGPLSPTPAELLASPQLMRLLQECAARYDYVLIDTSPVLAVADALAVAPIAGVILNVVRSGVSTVNEIEESVKHLNKAGRSVTGVVLNDSATRFTHYGYGERYDRGRSPRALAS
ncbi:polysaccharide biosynthesis tyrosine autokinase [Noviherbaspirillum galbum]|uniref:Putative tyrosine-protein kinase EpsB n=1 Tax=Noviherbaspirillum galbum TaxID=2709383 RepID=A0A6B3SZF6_9BURK|nr:polysaccharide biosynthesis tyrosine autokinase [Noviherbaspirillum galbum]NEX64029.1 polysaccharide biosynthesis tyrosine autokinase [Noviherbaspirillum galbum]